MRKLILGLTLLASLSSFAEVPEGLKSLVGEYEGKQGSLFWKKDCAVKISVATKFDARATQMSSDIDTIMKLETSNEDHSHISLLDWYPEYETMNNIERRFEEGSFLSGSYTDIELDLTRDRNLTRVSTDRTALGFLAGLSSEINCKSLKKVK